MFKGPSSGWFMRFKQRNPQLRFNKAEDVTKAASTVTAENIDYFFKNFKEFISDNHLEELYDRPEAFYNLDESGLQVNAQPIQVLSTKNVKHTYRVESTKHHLQITMTMCICANGTYLPPQIIFKKSFNGLEDAVLESESKNFFFH